MPSELERLAENLDPRRPWHRWGPYVSERQWGTVREDYSPDGRAWDWISHDMARSYCYRWGEDGIGGFSDRHGLVNISVALWNGRDPILKERLFGLTNEEGNHGEDVKEVYQYLDAVPSHAYLKMLYRYPQREFPYGLLVEENRNRGRADREFELVDTGIFEGNRFFDVVVEYAKAGPNDILWKITVLNRGPEAAPFWLLPQITLSAVWKHRSDYSPSRIREIGEGRFRISTTHYGELDLAVEDGQALFMENETNKERLYGVPNDSERVKDYLHQRVISGQVGSPVEPKEGTKMAILHQGILGPGESKSVRLRLSDGPQAGPFDDFEQIFADRLREANEFYASRLRTQEPELAKIQRLALAGLIWSKQYYHYDVDRWARGDVGEPPPPKGHAKRNKGWEHFHAGEVLSMPDKWEYPWFAAWDLAFHCIPLSLIDSTFAKDQLLLLLREWYMHPSGQIPAYEWAFGDVNPPVHAWATLRVFQIERRIRGEGDYDFLEKVFHKLLLNFTWWVNRKDAEGNNIFEGGFLGLDNIGLFDRNAPLGDGLVLEQSDGTSWMAMYCLNMLSIAAELCKHDPVYQDVASKFLEHFIYICSAMEKGELWDEGDGFYYDVVSSPSGEHTPVRARSLVGLIPIFAVAVLEESDLERMPDFTRRFEWFRLHRSDLMGQFCHEQDTGGTERQILSLVTPERLKRILEKVFDEQEFLGPYGIRSLSKTYQSQPHHETIGASQYTIGYEPAEGESGAFGGNSNWRGPVWMPINYLLVEALQLHDHFLGEGFQIEAPTGSGQEMSLWQASQLLSSRLISLFSAKCEEEFVWFYEYFDGDTGRGLGASHQTGWTALVAKLIDQVGVAASE